MQQKLLTSERSRFTRDVPEFSSYQIGAWTYGRPKVLSWGEEAALTVGSFCSFAFGVAILLGGEHNLDWVTTYPFNIIFSGAKEYKGHPRTKGDVVIGNDVWIGREALIMSGVTIGNGAVIGARSVITKDVLAYAVVAGNPANLIRLRFEREVIDALQAIAWWDWPIEKIEEAWPLLLSKDVKLFIEKYSK